MNKNRFNFFFGAGVLILAVSIMLSVAACSSSSPSPITSIPAAQAAPPAGNSATIDVTAQNMAFDTATITVKAGAAVTLNFNNKDTAPHNIAIYTDQSAAQMIYKGEVFGGPATKTYTFTAPSAPGTYFFRCDVHPARMTGQFIVQ